jgi:hypothetical protein
MNRKLLSSIAIWAFILGTNGLANGALIDFEDLGVSVGTQLNTGSGVSQNSGGFTFTPGPITTGPNDSHFHNQDGFGDNGGTNFGSHDDFVMTEMSGDTFSLYSFDFEAFISDGNISVVGNLSGGGSISQTFISDGFASAFGGTATYQTFLFGSGWENLTSANFNYQGNGSSGFFVDNINTTAPVPEPSTMLLFGAGLAGLIGFRRRKRKK